MELYLGCKSLCSLREDGKVEPMVVASWRSSAQDSFTLLGKTDTQRISDPTFRTTVQIPHPFQNQGSIDAELRLDVYDGGDITKSKLLGACRIKLRDLMSHSTVERALIHPNNDARDALLQDSQSRIWASLRKIKSSSTVPANHTSRVIDEFVERKYDRSRSPSPLFTKHSERGRSPERAIFDSDEWELTLGCSNLLEALQNKTAVVVVASQLDAQTGSVISLGRTELVKGHSSVRFNRRFRLADKPAFPLFRSRLQLEVFVGDSLLLTKTTTDPLQESFPANTLLGTASLRLEEQVLHSVSKVKVKLVHPSGNRTRRLREQGSVVLLQFRRLERSEVFEKGSSKFGHEEFYDEETEQLDSDEDELVREDTFEPYQSALLPHGSKLRLSVFVRGLINVEDVEVVVTEYMPSHLNTASPVTLGRFLASQPEFFECNSHAQQLKFFVFDGAQQLGSASISLAALRQKGPGTHALSLRTQVRDVGTKQARVWLRLHAEDENIYADDTERQDYPILNTYQSPNYPIHMGGVPCFNNGDLLSIQIGCHNLLGRLLVEVFLSEKCIEQIPLYGPKRNPGPRQRACIFETL